MSRLLVIDTATQACSVALFDDGRAIGGNFRQLGRGHAEHLVGMIAALPDKGKAEHIFINCGPGSFTGIRVGLAAAKALALAWQADISGYNGLQLSAVMALARLDNSETNIFIANSAGHGELFGQLFNPSAQPLSNLLTLPPGDMIRAIDTHIVAGTGLDLLPEGENSMVIYPDAQSFPAHSLGSINALAAAPVYGRAPDAVAAAKSTPMSGTGMSGTGSG